MKTSVKNIVATILAIGAVTGAASVHAAVAVPQTGNGELTLFVTNTTTSQVYARGLGLTINSIITQGTGAGQTGSAAFGAVNTLSYALPTFAADSTLQNFLTTGTTGEFTWNVIAGDNQGANVNWATDPKRYVLSTVSDLTVASPPGNTAMNTLGISMNTFLTDLNGKVPGNSGVTASGDVNYALLNGFFNQTPNNTVGNLGSAMNFFVIASGGPSNPSLARVFELRDIQLSALGTLSSVSAVPVPAAVWLLGSGLAGLLGIGRRRKLAVAA